LRIKSRAEKSSLARKLKWFKISVNEGVAVKISAIEKKPSTLHCDNRKDALRTSQELTRPYPLQAQGCTSLNSFERLCFGNDLLGAFSTGLPREVFPSHSAIQAL
jgi:hypothetical protein